MQLAENFLVCRILQLNGIKAMCARNVISSSAFAVGISNRTTINWKGFGWMWLWTNCSTMPAFA